VLQPESSDRRFRSRMIQFSCMHSQCHLPRLDFFSIKGGFFFSDFQLWHCCLNPLKHIGNYTHHIRGLCALPTLCACVFQCDPQEQTVTISVAALNVDFCNGDAVFSARFEYILNIIYVNFRFGLDLEMVACRGTICFLKPTVPH
jgi:hypothetical protein